MKKTWKQPKTSSRAQVSALAKWQPPPRRPPPTQDEMLRTVTYLAGYGLVAMSHPKGFLVGIEQLALEQSRSKLWRALARKLYARLQLLRWRPISELSGPDRTILITSEGSLVECHHYKQHPKKKTLHLHKPTHFCEIPRGRP